MVTRADFTTEEWTALHRGASGSGMLVSVSDRDFTDTFGEASAMAKYMAAQQTIGATELIRALAHEHGSGFGLTTSPDKMRAETMAALTAALVALEAKAPDDVDAYRTFVLGLAQALGDAKGGGTSPAEAAMIAEVQQALGTPSDRAS